ncbi:anti-sigma regulatory factor [Bacteroidales bacterium OttesenSCG-928-L14]|nr:anti-sigma regulatory factor [Bacteroidales bacterium OttesenSCG-928-L14]
MQFEFKIQGGNFSKAGHASSELKKILKQLDVDPSIVKRIVIALYEAEVNVVAHAYNGMIIIDIDENRVKIVIKDKGPGIPSIEQAMEKGYSTASPLVREMGFGAGMGLPNIKKNTDELNIVSEVNVGTTLEFINYFFKNE